MAALFTLTFQSSKEEDQNPNAPLFEMRELWI